MYLDVNGDGLNTAADVLMPSTTFVDVWLRINVNRNGTTAICDEGPGPLDMQSYEFFLRATGTLTYGAWNDSTAFFANLGDFANATDTYHGRYGFAALSPGTYKLGRQTLTGVADGARLDIIATSPVNPLHITSFGTACYGLDFDNSYKIPTDWLDVAGTYSTAVENVDPVIVAPLSFSTIEGSVVSIRASALDPDISNTVTLSQTNNAPFLQTSSFAGPETAPSITLDGTPNSTQAGSYTITWTAVDNATGTAAASTTITVANPNQAPVITAPATASGVVELLFSLTGSASDPDAQNVRLHMTNNAPFLTSSKSAGPSLNPVITLTGTPNLSQAGTYAVNWTAVDVAGAATPVSTAIIIASFNAAPTISQPADMTVSEGSTATQQLVASDPDGDPLSFGKVGTAPIFMSVSASGLVTLAPGFLDAGTYSATQVSVTDGTWTVNSPTFQIVVINTNRPPTVVAPVSIITFEGTPIVFALSAVDPDGDTVRLFVSNLSLGATFTDAGGGLGSFMWTPDYGQAGSYSVGFFARDSQGAIGSTHTVEIQVGDVNRAPTASAGGPYSGVVSVPITFNGTGSFDPDGTSLSYSWDFGDLATAAGATPVHTYVTGGTFTVTLTVSDGSLTGNASTIATLQSIFEAKAFTTNANATIKLGSGKATWCTQIEPVNGAFLNTAVIQPTITMKYGAGQIFAQVGKVSIGADRDANGVQEITACFAKTDLRTLFTGLPKGTNTVTVMLEGDLETGGKFRTNLTVDVMSTGGTLVASLSPNPLNPEGTLTLHTEREGALRVTLFDLSGRVVRILHDGSRVAAGYHDMRIDGRDGSGRRLPSGVYFYRVEAPEGTETGRFVLAR